MLQWMETTATHTHTVEGIDSQCYNGWDYYTQQLRDRQPMLQWMETTATHTVEVDRQPMLQWMGTTAMLYTCSNINERARNNVKILVLIKCDHIVFCVFSLLFIIVNKSG